MKCSTGVQVALLLFGFGLVETHMRLYLEDSEPAQILIIVLPVIWPLTLVNFH